VAHDGWGRTPEDGSGSGPEDAPVRPVADGSAEAGQPWWQQGAPGGPAHQDQPAAAGWPAAPAPAAPPSAPPPSAVPGPSWGQAAPPPAWGQAAPPPAGHATGATPAQPQPGGPQAAKPLAPWAAAAGPAGTRPAAAPARPVTAPPAGQGQGVGRRVLAGVLVVLLVGAAVAVTWFVQRDDGTQPAASSGYGSPLSPTTSARASDQSSEDAESSAPSSPTPSGRATPSTSATPTPAVPPEQQALAELQALRASSLPRLILDGRWVAQVASKSVGITDPLQVAANGSHTFYAVDILAESRAAVASVADSSSILVLQSVDFGKRSVAADGQPYWVTIVDAGFSSSDDVDLWCARTYPTLTADQLANACAARTLTAPHD
jgi:hypothetical protein